MPFFVSYNRLTDDRDMNFDRGKVSLSPEWSFLNRNIRPSELRNWQVSAGKLIFADAPFELRPGFGHSTNN